jgi:hypothetical protein
VKREETTDEQLTGLDLHFVWGFNFIISTAGTDVMLWVIGLVIENLKRDEYIYTQLRNNKRYEYIYIYII